MYNMDKLFDAVAKRGPVCVGLDTAVEYVPPRERRRMVSDAEAVLAFNKAIIDTTIDACACYKVQIAYYEEMGLAGLKAYAATLAYLRDRGALAIADIKRGDIADTASRYAKAHLDGEFEADFVTLAPYMGMDSVEPWLAYVRSKGKGAFVLMRTSNPGMRDFEYRRLAEGGYVYDAVGDKLQDLSASLLGERGYGAVGAVVGCTEQEEAADIRKKRDNIFFLIPGYGAQGGAAADAARLLRLGNGGVVNASRSILKAWTATSPGEAVQPPVGGASFAGEATLAQAASAARRATEEMRDSIRAACEAGAACAAGAACEAGTGRKTDTVGAR